MVQGLQSDGEFQRFQVAGRYQVGRLLGQGGTASVYEARDEVRDSAVALELLDVSGPRKESTRTRELFEREFHALTQLAHPRVVRALDYGIDGDTPYYTME